MPTNYSCSDAFDSRHILVVGGAGYIGSHMVLALQQAGFEPIVLDNLDKGHASAVAGTKLIIGEMADKNVLTQLFNTYSFSAVMHFASFIEVAESVKNPLQYYQNNVAATLILLEGMIKHNVKNFIFSSSAAVYGEPHYTPIDEVHPLNPITPYGRSKRMVEEIIQDLAKSDDLHYVILRYFNAAGAAPGTNLGEHHHPESHLIPLVLQVAAGKREHIIQYGHDYATQDGSCIRDYVHVMDICDAHLRALQALLSGRAHLICNLGTGCGYSVREVIESARRITGHAIPVVAGERRSGDPAILVANASCALQQLNWQPRYANLDILIEHAWQSAQYLLPA